MNLILTLALAAFAAGRVQAQPAQPGAEPERPTVTSPPELVFERIRGDEETIQIARNFYSKYVDVGGMPVLAHADVADRALQRTYEIVRHMLAGRPDVLAAMRENGMYLVIIGKDQLYTDMPEYRNRSNPDYLNERVRGTGGRPTSFGEENLLSLPVDRYDDESIAVHEFAHTIDRTLRSVDPAWTDRRNEAFENARSKGLYENTYAGGNPGEYWGEIVQSYFDCNRVNNWNHGPVGRREQLKVFDPEGYELVRTALQLGPDQDWRYRWLQELPNVEPPPARFAIDPYYTKFTWAREFTVVGRRASDEALLKANDTIRKMFAYRHDILKALIADGVKLVVLGREEGIADLPEYKKLNAEQAQRVDPLARYLNDSPEMRLLVVGEENVLADPAAPNVGDNQVIRVLAIALYHVAGTRPVDPDWETRPRNLRQQYELRVERLDTRFDRKLEQLYEAATSAGKWRRTAAVHDPLSYWVAGVLAYFDARGQDAAPEDASWPMRTREALEAYDPGLFRLVDETMAYRGKVDWRYAP